MNNLLLKFSLWLLKGILPAHLKNDICGDLEEEFLNYTSKENTEYQACVWLIKQTVSTAFRYACRGNNLLVVFTSVACISIFLTLNFAIIWLSDLDDISAYNDVFWQQWLQGYSYTVFWQFAFWQYVNSASYFSHNFGIFYDFNALIYTVIALLSLNFLRQRYEFSIAQIVFFSALLLLMPYLGAIIQFMLFDVQMKQSGPITAFVWLSTLYLILPVGYQIIRSHTYQEVALP